MALELRQRGMEAEAFEQAAEIDAAMALSANTTRDLRRLGLLDAVMAASTEPIDLIWRDGRRIAAHPVHHGLRCQERFGAPCCGIRRTDLQRALSGALGGAGLHLGHRLAAVEDHGGDVNYFAAAEGPTVWPRDGGSTAEIQHGKALAAFEGWHLTVMEMLAATEHTVRWRCSWRPTCCAAAAAGRSCWATPRTRRRRITARARTPRSRMPSPWRSFSPARGRIGWTSPCAATRHCAAHAPARSSAARGRRMPAPPAGRPRARGAERGDGPVPRAVRLDS